jgi:hypothetical protein
MPHVRLSQPLRRTGAKQLAYQQLLVMWSQATPASDENTHKPIQSFAQQPQTVVVPDGARVVMADRA